MRKPVGVPTEEQRARNQKVEQGRKSEEERNTPAYARIKQHRRVTKWATWWALHVRRGYWKHEVVGEKQYGNHLHQVRKTSDDVQAPQFPKLFGGDLNYGGWGGIYSHTK